jgi:hypothetical protein
MVLGPDGVTPVAVTNGAQAVGAGAPQARRKDLIIQPLIQLPIQLSI